jgi:hypothetical protein
MHVTKMHGHVQEARYEGEQNEGDDGTPRKQPTPQRLGCHAAELICV